MLFRSCILMILNLKKMCICIQEMLTIKLEILQELSKFIRVIWLLRRAPRHNKERIGVLLWLGWLLMHVVIFSMTSGTIHPYYVVAMAPAVAALVGIGAPYIWQAYTRRTKIAWLLPLSIAATTILSVVMLGYNNYWPWLMWLVMIAGGVATILTLLPL